jgi:hypothetical protein
VRRLEVDHEHLHAGTGPELIWPLLSKATPVHSATCKAGPGDWRESSQLAGGGAEGRGGRLLTSLGAVMGDRSSVSLMWYST